MLSPSQKIGSSAGMIVLLTMLLWGMAIENRWTVACLERSGVNTTATISDKHKRRGKNSPSHHVTYRFVDAAGNEHEGRERVGANDYETRYVGQRTPVLYCPADPQRNSLDLTQFTNDARGSMFVALVASPIFAIIILFMWIKAGCPTPRRMHPPREDDIVWTDAKVGFFRRIFR